MHASQKIPRSWIGCSSKETLVFCGWETLALQEGVNRVPYWLLGDLGEQLTHLGSILELFDAYFFTVSLWPQCPLTRKFKESARVLVFIHLETRRWVPEEMINRISLSHLLPKCLIGCMSLFKKNSLFIQASGSDYLWFVKRIQTFSYLFLYRWQTFLMLFHIMTLNYYVVLLLGFCSLFLSLYTYHI